MEWRMFPWNVIMSKKKPNGGNRKNRSRLYHMFRGVCQICQTHVPFNRATRGHIIPFSHGGTYRWNNLQLECYDCNSKKGDKCPGCDYCNPKPVTSHAEVLGSDLGRLKGS